MNERMNESSRASVVPVMFGQPGETAQGGCENARASETYTADK